MTREIKFRAWVAEDKKMLYGNEITDGGYFLYFDGDIGTVDFACPDGGIGGNHKNVIALQFTGLLDKNGREIYEGDVVRYDFLPEGNDQTGTVIYKGRSFQLSDGHNYMPEEVEIIGNIYENGDLIK